MILVSSLVVIFMMFIVVKPPYTYVQVEAEFIKMSDSSARVNDEIKSVIVANYGNWIINKMYAFRVMEEDSRRTFLGDPFTGSIDEYTQQ